MPNPIHILHILSDKQTERNSLSLKDFLAALNQRGLSSELMYFPGNPYQRLATLIPVIRKKKIQIVHSHDLASMTCGALASRLTGIRSIHTQHQKDDRKVAGWIWNLPCATVFDSENIKESISQKNHIKKNKTKIISQGFELAQLNAPLSAPGKSELRRRMSLREDSLIIGNHAPLIASEDQATLLKAMRNLIRKKVNAQLILSGDGPLRQDIENIVCDFDLTDHVKFFDNGTDVKTLLKLFDVVVCSSYKEEISSVVIEGMAAGKPVIATKIGGNNEIVKEGETGFVIPCGFPERIESVLMRFSANRTWAEKIGQAARLHYENNLSLASMTSQYENLYRKDLYGY